MYILKIKRAFILTVFVLTTVLNTYSQAWRSELYPYKWTPGFAKDGKFIQDFSYAGYKYNFTDPPTAFSLILDVTKPPYNADKTGNQDVTTKIQNAIDSVSKRGGGVVFLPAGTYKVQPASTLEGASTLSIRNNNVVLRGAKLGETRIMNVQTNMREKSIISIKPAVYADWHTPLPSSEVPLLQDASEHDKTFFLTKNSFVVGDLVVIKADMTDDWIAEHGMKGYWNTGLDGVTFIRTIKSINTTAKTITVDIPIRYYLKIRDNARVYKIKNQITGSGVENLFIGNLQIANLVVGDYTTDDDFGNSAKSAYKTHHASVIKMEHAQDCWVKNVSTFSPPGNSANVHILSNGVLLEQCRLITIDSCNFKNPQYKGEGGNGYMFTLNSNDCLIKNSVATNARHSFSFKLATSNGNVIHKCEGNNPRLGADFHQLFSVTNLFDNYTCNGDYIDAQYRPYPLGSPYLHGQTTTQSVIWNTNGIKYNPDQDRNLTFKSIVRSGQFGNGYVIGSQGLSNRVGILATELSFSGLTYNTLPADHLEGEGTGANLRPLSLYSDQVSRRYNGLGSSDTYGLSFNLIPQVRLTSPSVDTFVNFSTPFTISATASDADGSINRVVFYRGSTIMGTDYTAPYSYVWTTPATSGTFEIKAVAFDNQGATNSTATAVVSVKQLITNILYPIHDTYVVGGDSANRNYGNGYSQSRLLIKNNPGDMSNTMRTLLKFYVKGTTNIIKAKLRIYKQFGEPNLIRVNRTTDDWVQGSVTWNSMPPLGGTVANSAITAQNAYIEWDVTNEVISEAKNDISGWMSLVLNDRYGANTLLGMNSKDSVKDNLERRINKPELVLITNGTASSLQAFKSNDLIVANKEKNELLVYPDPAQNIISVISPKDAKPKMIVLYNSFGQILLQKPVLENKGGSISVDISKLINGVYTLKLIGAKNMATKFIKE